MVLDSLEQRWNEKLTVVEQLKQKLSEEQQAALVLDEQDKKSILQLGKNFSKTWLDEHCDIELKKKILRSLINEIIVDIDEQKNQINMIVHWQGGVHSSIDLPRPMPATRAHKTSEDDTEIIKKMAKRYDDSEIAKVLCKLGRKTGKGNNWDKRNVATIRRRLGIKARNRLCQEGILNLAEASRYCGVSNSSIMKLIHEGVLQGNQIVQFAPFEIKQHDLDTEPVSSIIKTLKETGKLNIEGSVPGCQTPLRH